MICTYGGSEAYKSIEPIIESKGAELVGKFSCKGYDTFGPFKLIGGVAKGHPNDMDLVAAVDFFENLLKNTQDNSLDYKAMKRGSGYGKRPV